MIRFTRYDPGQARAANTLLARRFDFDAVASQGFHHAFICPHSDTGTGRRELNLERPFYTITLRNAFHGKSFEMDLVCRPPCGGGLVDHGVDEAGRTTYI